eukprot:TRINITY_DN10473_c0_g1_i3.p1 TRINITY_DN10473_c0_g1~~TRINITY_DN10473_c0_g1_i3.p1  ORF type:complete len:404 (+),score=74.65 TRINITY_DN10473_c0_g1_i3:84-1295(+)
MEGRFDLLDEERNRNGVSPTTSTKSRVSRRTLRKSSSSKYDYVKVHVQLEGHSYVLSRFLVNRVLAVTKVDYEDAIQISLELKRRLVDGDRMTISHSELERQLFEIMKEFGYADEYVQRFHHQRIPLIILMCGTACIGKSVLATQLAERLNLPSVLQTRLIYEIMHHSSQCFNEVPLYLRKVFSSSDSLVDHDSKEKQLIDCFRNECALIRTGVNGDIEKCLMEGKSIIVEGFHLDPAQYMDLIQTGVFLKGNGQDSIEFTAPSFSKTDAISGTLSVLGQQSSPQRRIPAVIIPFVFSLGDSDRKAFIQDWISHHDPTAFYDVTLAEEERAHVLHQNYGVIQDYLKQFASQVNIVNMSAVTIQETVGALHDTVLKTIEAFFMQYDAQPQRNEAKSQNASGLGV